VSSITAHGIAFTKADRDHPPNEALHSTSELRKLAALAFYLLACKLTWALGSTHTTMREGLRCFLRLPAA
jgi:hypothetical protein